MPFIISPTNNHYARFKCLIERYRQVICLNATAHCITGFTAAAIIRNDDSADLRSFETWLKSLQMTDQQNKQDAVIDQILSSLETCQRQQERLGTIRIPRVEERDEVKTTSQGEEDFNYELKRYKCCDSYTAYI